MEQDTSPGVTLEEIHARMGIAVTAEGKARARRRLEDADTRRDHDARAAFLAQLRTRSA
ncbi:hypothetical protein [Actinoplanes sp. NBRC 101535]|uniref:hypothetical protein n=1 Tax=Actinoplanes sp. NBRC 101535 TaxID=3032196 RepID=UPI0024A1F77C|nr:hypothetical protein [Actinoplanes sp. NBRC 101535]GLY02535.1 hypothetical protein Acsp01_29140 [Actinoplanes sp. NBRC 101535]